MKMSGNTILITGGGSGIGYGLAESFSRLGNEVIICGRREEKLKEAQENCPGLHIKTCDVTDRNEQKELFKWATGKFQNLNILVNNAGIQRDIDFTKGIEDLVGGENEITLNFEAPVFLSALFIPHLARQHDASIVNVSSGLAFFPFPVVPVYCATKAALHTFSMMLRQQLARTSIKVYEVIPPAVDTDLNREGRDRRNMKYRGLKLEEYIPTVIKGFEEDRLEIRYEPAVS